MSTLREIEDAIEKLPRDEVFKLGEWLQHRIDEEWDSQFESDVHAGRLDAVAQRALEEHRAGNPLTFQAMESKAVASFWEGYYRLPEEIQRAARKQYHLWLNDPHHPSVRFKKVGEFW